ncbi:hypothetical protein CGRA01v4_04568 [Colletotrichum graminicola]|nr:hypothetical protein CGRA01v4_04568 [Colletotrichum graminicola]
MTLWRIRKVLVTRLATKLKRLFKNAIIRRKGGGGNTRLSGYRHASDVNPLVSAQRHFPNQPLALEIAPHHARRRPERHRLPGRVVGRGRHRDARDVRVRVGPLQGVGLRRLPGGRGRGGRVRVHHVDVGRGVEVQDVRVHPLERVRRPGHREGGESAVFGERDGGEVCSAMVSSTIQNSFPDGDGRGERGGGGHTRRPRRHIVGGHVVRKVGDQRDQAGVRRLVEDPVAPLDGDPVEAGRGRHQGQPAGVDRLDAEPLGIPLGRGVEVAPDQPVAHLDDVAVGGLVDGPRPVRGDAAVGDGPEADGLDAVLLGRRGVQVVHADAEHLHLGVGIEEFRLRLWCFAT